MRKGNSRVVACLRGGAALAVVLALSGCGGGSYIGSLFGSGSQPTEQPVASAQAPAGGVANAPVTLSGRPAELACPYVDVREGAAAHRVYAGGQSNANVRHQFSIGDIVRDCRANGNQLVMKVGVEGRVLLGPAGSPGSFTVPVSIAVRDETTKQFIVNRTFRVAASIPQGASNTTFAVVSDEITIPLKSLAANDDYQVFVGFDGASAAAGSQRSTRR